mgnify:CR=1 FL=1
MHRKRRQILQSIAASVAATGLGASRIAGAAGAPVLGLIFPPFGRGVPEEGVAMYGDSLRFVVTGL